MNTQGLLNFQTPGLSANVTPSAPQFIEQKLIGGQVQIGQPAQQIGPSSEAAMYGALAEIAQGTAKGLDNFGRISSMIEKNKIEKAKLAFDEIDAMEDLDPEAKVEEFDKRTKDIYTPILGEDWRKELTNRSNKQWLSTPARNAYEEMRYNKALGEWRNRPENQGGLDTPEEIDRFQQEYAFRYPSANFNDWFKRERGTTVAGVSINKGKRLVLDFKTLLDTMYDVPTKEEFAEYTLNSSNPAIQKQFEEKFPKFLELMGTLNIAGGPEVVYETIYNHIKGSYLDTELSGRQIPPSVVEAILPELDSLVTGKVSQFMSLHFEESAIKQAQAATTGVIMADASFQNKKDIKSYLDEFIDPVSAIGLKERSSFIYALVPQILTTKQDQPAFARLPFYKQVEQIRTEIITWYQSKDAQGNSVNKQKFDKLLKGTFGEGITFDSWLNGITGTLASSDTGKTIVKTQTDRVINDLNLGKTILELPGLTNPEYFINERERQLSELLGIPKEIVEQFNTLVESDDDELGRFVNNATIEEFYNNLTDAQKAELSQRGFSENNLEQLTRVLSAYADMKYTSVGKGSSGSKEITGIPDAGALGHVIRSRAINPNDETFRATVLHFLKLPPKEQAEIAARAPHFYHQVQLLQTENTAFNTLIREKRETLVKTIEQVQNDPTLPESEKKPIIDYLNQSLAILPQAPIGLYNLKDNYGNPIPLKVVSPTGFAAQGKAFLTESTPGSPANQLNQNGIEHYLRIEYFASRLAQEQQPTPERTAFFNEFEQLLKQVGSSNFAEVSRDNPMLIYSIAAVLSGIRKGDPTGQISSYVSGMDSELTKMLGVLISGAADYNGGVLYSLNTQDENHPMNRRIKTLGAFLDVTTGPLAQNGYGGSNELLPREYGISKPADRLQEISSVKIGLVQKTGQNSYRDPRVIQNLANVFNFGTSTGQTNSEAFRDAISNLFPDIKVPAGSQVFLTDVNGATVAYDWNSLNPEQQAQYYLTHFFERTGDTGVKFIASWLQEIEQNPQVFQDPNLFSSAGRYIVTELPMAVSGQRQSSITQYHTENNVTIGTQERFAWNWFGTVNPSQTFSHRPERVVDAKNYRRAELFDLAQGLRGTSANVLNQDATIPWATVGSEFTVGDATYLIGETTTESRFIVESLLSQEPNYQQYSFWVKTLGGQPVNETEFNRVVTETSKNNPLLRPPMRDVGLPRETRLIKNVDLDVVKAPLAAVMLRLNPTEGSKLLDTDLNGNYHLGLSVDNGLLQVEIGKQRYTLPGNLKEVYLKPGQYTNENDLTRRRNYTEYLRQEWLKLQRTHKVTQ